MCPRAYRVCVRRRGPVVSWPAGSAVSGRQGRGQGASGARPGAEGCTLAGDRDSIFFYLHHMVQDSYAFVASDADRANVKILW